MKAKQNWENTRQRYKAWWRGDLTESPLMHLVVQDSAQPVRETKMPIETADIYLDVDVMLDRYSEFLQRHTYVADSYPAIDMNLGPGSLALYLGSEPVFAEDTVWYKECVHDSWNNFQLKFDENNHWWRTHCDILRRAVEVSNGEFYVNIPDLIENMDIISAMRGPQNTCYDLMDEPEIIMERLNDLDSLYFKYYDTLYDLLKDDQGGSSYTAFHIWGSGKTAKVQSDFCALMSPGQFVDFVIPSLTRQCDKLTNSMYHLDGPDAIKHLPELMKIESLQALQWTAGAGQPDGGSECWYHIYDKVREANKSLWISVEDGDAYTMLEKIRKLIRRYGVNAMFINLPVMDRASADEILKAAANGFK